MIRVLLDSRSTAKATILEALVRSSAGLVFAGTLDMREPTTGDVEGDVLLVHLEDGHETDWDALAELPLPVLVLLDASEAGVIAAALRAGVRGVIPADTTPDELESAVVAVNQGLVVMTSDSAQKLLPTPLPSEPAEPLSEREREVLQLVADGLSNKLIAHQLNISEHTVKTHVASIFGKLRASNRTDAVTQAIRRGLVML